MWKGRRVQGFLGSAEESRAVTMCTRRRDRRVKWGCEGLDHQPQTEAVFRE